jgi:hypothetical protein
MEKKNQTTEMYGWSLTLAGHSQAHGPGSPAPRNQTRPESLWGGCAGVVHAEVARGAAVEGAVAAAPAQGAPERGLRALAQRQRVRVARVVHVAARHCSFLVSSL